MLRFNLLLFCLLCLFLKTSAQRQNTYFLKDDGRYVNQADSADYIRHVIEPARGSDLYRIKEYYPDGTRKSEGLSSKINPPLYEGVLTTFFPNGNIKGVSTYLKGQPIDTTTCYYPDGKLYSIQVYKAVAKPVKGLPRQEHEVEILTVKDTAGKDRVRNGNGDYIGYDSDFKEITETGKIKNGKQDGIWTGKIKDNFSRYTEIYADGKLISGESTDEKNISYKYTESRRQPAFKGGINKFYNYLTGHTRYPPSCSKYGIQGVAIVRFVVEKDGTLTDIKVLNTIHPDLAAEAIRVMSHSPKWEPGIWKGKAVRVSYNVPLSFNL
ncbi:energy transducer TonB [Pedobacter lusitanus]|uniref:energy transducer TonB n=1 Tax=Pedobacter lusitanus TaxID=1503925 RepID=UPI000697F53F|nr:energy transducer TonB [Pedobacter lusitanus]